MFIDVTEELEAAHQRQLEIDRSAPTPSKFKRGDRVTCDLPSFDGIGTVVYTWYLPYCGKEGKWCVKADVEGGHFASWQGFEGHFNLLEAEHESNTEN